MRRSNCARPPGEASARPSSACPPRRRRTRPSLPATGRASQSACSSRSWPAPDGTLPPRPPQTAAGPAPGAHRTRPASHSRRSTHRPPACPDRRSTSVHTWPRAVHMPPLLGSRHSAVTATQQTACVHAVCAHVTAPLFAMSFTPSAALHVTPVQSQVQSFTTATTIQGDAPSGQVSRLWAPLLELGSNSASEGPFFLPLFYPIFPSEISLHTISRQGDRVSLPLCTFQGDLG